MRRKRIKKCYVRPRPSVAMILSSAARRAALRVEFPLGKKHGCRVAGRAGGIREVGLHEERLR